MRFHLSVELPDDLACLPRLRRTVRESLMLCQVCAEDIDTIELLLGELATNAACHANAGHYLVNMEITDNSVILTVTDNGIGFQRDDVLPPVTLRSGVDGVDRIGGMGLPLVEMLADEVVFTSMKPQGTSVQAVKYINFR
ncbi:MAG: ATP-binding protein [Fibrella sp.]|nr:ATP-binding protein [Armatimonadota bacterium]